MYIDNFIIIDNYIIFNYSFMYEHLNTPSCMSRSSFKIIFNFSSYRNGIRRHVKIQTKEFSSLKVCMVKNIIF